MYEITKNLSVSFEAEDGTWELLDDEGDDFCGFVSLNANGTYSPHWEEEGPGDHIEHAVFADAVIDLVNFELFPKVERAPRMNWNKAAPPRPFTPRT
jgi:hypothetical protein